LNTKELDVGKKIIQWTDDEAKLVLRTAMNYFNIQNVYDLKRLKGRFRKDFCKFAEKKMKEAGFNRTHEQVYNFFRDRITSASPSKNRYTDGFLKKLFEYDAPTVENPIPGQLSMDNLFHTPASSDAPQANASLIQTPIENFEQSRKNLLESLLAADNNIARVLEWYKERLAKQEEEIKALKIGRHLSHTNCEELEEKNNQLATLLDEAETKLREKDRQLKLLLAETKRKLDEFSQQIQA